MFRLNRIERYVAVFTGIVALVTALYNFIPDVRSFFSPLKEEAVVALLKEHESFVSNGNLPGMISKYHPDFSMEVVHSNGYSETFDLPQLVKLQTDIRRVSKLKLNNSLVKISMIDKNTALVLITADQSYSVGFFKKSEKLAQSMVITNYWWNPKIIKVLSIAELI